MTQRNEQLDMDKLKERTKKASDKRPSLREGPPSSSKRKSVRSGSEGIEDVLKGEVIAGTGTKPLEYRQGNRRNTHRISVDNDVLLEENETNVGSRSPPNRVSDSKPPQESGKPGGKSQRKSFDQTHDVPGDETEENMAEPKNPNDKGRRNTDSTKQEKRRASIDAEYEFIDHELERRDRKLSLKKAIEYNKRASINPTSSIFEKHVRMLMEKENKTETETTARPAAARPAMYNVVKMAVSQHKHVNIVVEEKPKVVKKKRNSAKALLVKKKRSKAAVHHKGVKVKKPVATDEDLVEDEEDTAPEVGPQPAPYWVQMVAEKKNLIKKLRNVADIGEALDHNPELLTYLFKHPNFGRRLVEKSSVAHEVIEHPKRFKEIAHKAKTTETKGHGPRHDGHPIIFLGHKYHIDDVHIHYEDRATMIARSKISLQRDQVVFDGNHRLKALMGVERVYLKHDEIVYEGFLVFCDRKMHRYFFLDVDGKVIYHIRDYQFFANKSLRVFDYGLLDQEGNEVLRMKKRFSLTSKQRVDVYCPPGNFIGYVSQSFGIGTPSFWIKNHEKHEFIEIRSCGRNWKSYCNKKDYQFEFIIKVVTTQHDMGLISTSWFEKQMETFSLEPFYGIHWNDEMTLNVKGLLLSSMLLVYLTYYNGRLDKRLYVERYKTPGRPSYSVCEEDLEN